MIFATTSRALLVAMLLGAPAAFSAPPVKVAAVENTPVVAAPDAGGHVYTRGDGLLGHGPVIVTALIDRGDPASRAEIPYLANLVAKTDRVTVNIKELPLISQNSVDLSRRLVAIRLHMSSRIWEEMEFAIARSPGEVTPERIDRQAAALGVPNLAELAMGQDVTDYLRDVRKFAYGISVHATPVIMVGDQLRVGLQTTDMLLDVLKTAKMPAD